MQALKKTPMITEITDLCDVDKQMISNHDITPDQKSSASIIPGEIQPKRDSPESSEAPQQEISSKVLRVYTYHIFAMLSFTLI